MGIKNKIVGAGMAVAMMLMGAGCGSEGEVQDLGGGMKLTILEAGDGPPVVPGGMIKGFLQIMSSNGDVLRTDRREEGPQPMPVDRPSHAADVQHAMLKLRAGDSARIEIENDSVLAHPNAPRMLKKGERTIFTLKVVSVLDSAQAKVEMAKINAEMAAKQAQQEKEDEVIMKEDSVSLKKYMIEKGIKAEFHPVGFYKKTIKEGSGPKSVVEDVLTVNYKGMFLDGKVFDESKTVPFIFQVGSRNVIPAWSIGGMDLQKGQKIILYVPSYLAYGPNGVPPSEQAPGIPPRSHLMFEMEVLDIKKPQMQGPPSPGME